MTNENLKQQEQWQNEWFIEIPDDAKNVTEESFFYKVVKEIKKELCGKVSIMDRIGVDVLFHHINIPVEVATFELHEELRLLNLKIEENLTQKYNFKSPENYKYFSPITIILYEDPDYWETPAKNGDYVF